jgi:hypothetical protein
MENSRRLLLTVAAVAAAVVTVSEPSFARGGPPSIMDSPGYQRRLQESRQQLSQPAVQAPSVHRHKKQHHQHD